MTDFGTADGYVGELKGVIAARAPGVAVVDIAHDVMPQDVDGARLALARYWRRWPEGTVHLVVVDPEVGGERLALAVHSDGRWLVGPDNGVLSPALLLPAATAVALPVPADAAPTFHGRDVFAPAAARLATGTPLEQLGPVVAAPVIRRSPEAHRLADGRIGGEVIAVDRFGNCATNLRGKPGQVVEVGGLRVPVVRTYADAPDGACVALTGSSGWLEVAVRGGSAAHRLGIARGAMVVLG